MQFDQPHLYEIEDMMEFVKNQKRLYIYGCAMNQEYLLKFFDSCGVNVDGYITTYPDDRQLCYRQIPKYTLDEFDFKAGCVIGLSDKYFGDVMPRLRKRGFKNYFIISEFNKNKIAHKLTPRPRELMWIEFNVADSCNLNCAGCNHFSPLVKTNVFLEPEDFEHDIKRLSELSDKYLGRIKLIGGEPLLHPQLHKLIEIARYYFPKSSLEVWTNGLLLSKCETGNINMWRFFKEKEVLIHITHYPINLDYTIIKNLAEKYSVRLTYGEEVKYFEKHCMDLKGCVELFQYISCWQFNKCMMVRNGKLYTCNIIALSKYFNEAFDQNLTVDDSCSIDIHKVSDYQELAEFLTRRAPFCNFCDIKHRSLFPWEQSKGTIDEYIDI